MENIAKSSWELSPVENFYTRVFCIQDEDCETLVLPEHFYDRVLELGKDCLSERSFDILRRTLDGDTAVEIGEHYGLSRSRINQIQHKNERYFRVPARRRYLKDGYDVREVAREKAEEKRRETIAEIVAKAEAEVREKLGNLSAEQIVEKYSEDESLIAAVVVDRMRGAKAGQLPEDDLSRPLDDMELPIRPYNALRRCGCDTISDVIGLIRFDALKDVRNLGNKSIQEVHAKCDEFAPNTMAEINDGQWSTWTQKVRDLCSDALCIRTRWPSVDTIMRMSADENGCEPICRGVASAKDLFALIADWHDYFKCMGRQADDAVRVMETCKQIIESAKGKRNVIR